MSDIPVVGRPVDLVLWYPTTVVRCRCKEKAEEQAIIVIIGLQQVAACPLCMRAYHINRIKPDGEPELQMAIQSVRSLISQ